jgi:VanZ family protein
MLPLRYVWIWLLVGLLLLGFGLASALSPMPSGMVSINDKLLHTAGFLVFMVWFGGIFERRFLPGLALGLVLYGLLIELLQGLTLTRQAEGLDLVADAAGILLGWRLSAAGLSHWCTKLESWLPRPNP